MSQPQRDSMGRMLPGNKLAVGRKQPPSKAALVRNHIEPDILRVIDQLKANAQSEDGAVANGAARVLLEYFAPKPRNEPEKVTIPGFDEAVGIAQKFQCVERAMANGLLSPESAERVGRVLEMVHKITSIEQLVADVEMLKAGRMKDVVDA